MTRNKETFRFLSNIFFICLLYLFGCTGSLPEGSAEEDVYEEPDVCNEMASTEVDVTTNKSTYQPGEVLLITIKNKLSEGIFSHIGSQTPVFAINYVHTKTEKGWKDLYAQCQPPHCFYDIDFPAEIKAGESATMEWYPYVYDNGTTERRQLMSGHYTISILYKNSIKTDWKIACSNKFEIENSKKGGTI
jgi:hypothetical protein